MFLMLQDTEVDYIVKIGLDNTFFSQSHHFHEGIQLYLSYLGTVPSSTPEECDPDDHSSVGGYKGEGDIL